MKKNFVLIAALIAAFTVAFVSCGDDGVVSGTGEKTPAIELFATITGMSSGITAGGKAVVTGDVIDFSDTSGSAIITVTTPAKAGETITVTYFCKALAGSPEFILKNPDWSDATGASPGGLYPTLKVGEVATIELKADAYADPTKIAFQRNHDGSNAFLMKIISVTAK
jgi:hypothetical protein